MYISNQYIAHATRDKNRVGIKYFNIINSTNFYILQYNLYNVKCVLLSILLNHIILKMSGLVLKYNNLLRIRFIIYKL